MRYLLLALSLPVFSQVVTLSPAGAAALQSLTGRRIPGVQILSVIVCGEGSVTAGRVYAAAVQARFSPIPPVMANSLVRTTVSGNWRNHVLEAVQVLSIAAAGLTASGVIKAGASWTIGLTTGHSIVDYLSDRLRGRLPDAGPLTASLLDPESSIDLTRGCKSSQMLSLYGKGFQSAPVRVDMAVPVGVPTPTPPIKGVTAPFILPTLPTGCVQLSDTAISCHTGGSIGAPN